MHYTAKRKLNISLARIDCSIKKSGTHFGLLSCLSVRVRFDVFHASGVRHAVFGPMVILCKTQGVGLHSGETLMR